MGPSEIGHRIKEQSKKIISRHKHYEWSDFASNGAIPALPYLRVAFFAHTGEELKDAVRAKADSILSGALKFMASSVHSVL